MARAYRTRACVRSSSNVALRVDGAVDGLNGRCGIAIALAGMDTQDIMPPTLFREACAALGDSVDAFVGRTSTRGGLAGDLAWMWTTQPWAEANLAWVVMAGVYADARSRDRYRGEFGLGAREITHSLVELATEGAGGFSTASNAIETASMGVRGSLGVQVAGGTADVVSDLWLTVVRRLIGPAKETLHEVETLSELLLAGVYDAESERPTATRMRDGLTEALILTEAITDDFDQRRKARAWIGAGRAALGRGDSALAQMIATAIAPDVRELLAALRERPWAADSDELMNAVRAGARAMRLPDLPDTHTRPEVVAAFDALLDKKPPRRRRAPRNPPPSDGAATKPTDPPRSPSRRRERVDEDSPVVTQVGPDARVGKAGSHSGG